MRRSVRWAVSSVCLMGAVVLGLLGSVSWEKSALMETGITLTAENNYGAWVETEGNSSGEITLAQARHIRETEIEKENPVDFTAWRGEEKGTVTDEEGLRSAVTTILRLCGTSEYLIPYGKILQEEDKEGCLLGEKTAEQLFGSHEVEGLTVLCDGRKLIVRGVIREPAEVFLLQETKETAVFDRITLKKAETSRETARKFRDSYGLEKMTIINAKEHIWDALLSLVPGKWSDFDGWQENIESRRGETAAEEKAAKSIFQQAETKQRRMAVFLWIGSGTALFCGMVMGKEGIKVK